MLFTLIYFTAFFGIAYLAFKFMHGNMQSIQRASQRPTPLNVPHPELLDRDGKPITDPLLVINVVESSDEVRRRLEDLYNKSQDAPER